MYNRLPVSPITAHLFSDVKYATLQWSHLKEKLSSLSQTFVNNETLSASYWDDDHFNGGFIHEDNVSAEWKALLYSIHAGKDLNCIKIFIFYFYTF